jgi:hypothetical protein
VVGEIIFIVDVEPVLKSDETVYTGDESTVLISTYLHPNFP